jgi:HK97 family phage prohead protease
MMKGSAMLSLPTGEERRDLTLSDASINIRDAEGGTQRFSGYASVFNVRTAIGNPLTWGFYEEVAEGSFTKTLSEGDARMLIDHDSYYVVSRVSAGTLYLSQDQRGLLTDSTLNTGLSYVNDLKTNLQIRNITGMSFGFQVTKDDWATEEVSTSDGNSVEVEVRIIREVKLIEVSAVTFPAYEETTAGLRHSLVPALLRRGDQAAIARAARYRPELAPLLGYDPELARSVVDLGSGEVLGTDTPITAKGNTMEPSEERLGKNESASEPGETTRGPDSDETPEPAASTRNAPSERELAQARLRQLEKLRRQPVAA